MKPEQIYVGNINKCTMYKTVNLFGLRNEFGFSPYTHIKTQSEIHKENAVLIKLRESKYVELESLKNLLKILRILMELDGTTYSTTSPVMDVTPFCEDILFVDEASLKPYYKEPQNMRSVSVRKLIKETNSQN